MHISEGLPRRITAKSDDRNKRRAEWKCLLSYFCKLNITVNHRIMKQECPPPQKKRKWPSLRRPFSTKCVKRFIGYMEKSIYSYMSM
jgi:hypothetical protein